MKLSFIAACLYWYGREGARLAAYLLAVLGLLFVIHKLVSWSLWVLSL